MAEAALPTRFGTALLDRPFCIAPAVASITKLPSASNVLRLILRVAAKLIEPVSVAFTDTKRVASSIRMSRLASTEISPSVCRVFCINTSCPVELRRIEPVLLVSNAVLITLPVA